MKEFGVLKVKVVVVVRELYGLKGYGSERAYMLRQLGKFHGAIFLSNQGF